MLTTMANNANTNNNVKASRGEFKYLMVPASWRSNDRIPSFKVGNRFEMEGSPLYSGVRYGYGRICRKGMKLLYEEIARIEEVAKLTDEAKWHAMDTFERSFEQLWSEWLLPCTAKASMSAEDSRYALRKLYFPMGRVLLETRENPDAENWFWQIDVASKAGAYAALYALYLVMDGYVHHYNEL